MLYAGHKHREEERLGDILGREEEHLEEHLEGIYRKKRSIKDFFSKKKEEKKIKSWKNAPTQRRQGL
jgi:hypothetical protein